MFFLLTIFCFTFISTIFSQEICGNDDGSCEICVENPNCQYCPGIDEIPYLPSKVPISSTYPSSTESEFTIDRSTKTDGSLIDSSSAGKGSTVMTATTPPTRAPSLSLPDQSSSAPSPSSPPPPPPLPFSQPPTIAPPPTAAGTMPSSQPTFFPSPQPQPQPQPTTDTYIPPPTSAPSISPTFAPPPPPSPPPPLPFPPSTMAPSPFPTGIQVLTQVPTPPTFAPTPFDCSIHNGESCHSCIASNCVYCTFLNTCVNANTGCGTGDAGCTNNGCCKGTKKRNNNNNIHNNKHNINNKNIINNKRNEKQKSGSCQTIGTLCSQGPAITKQQNQCPLLLSLQNSQSQQNFQSQPHWNVDSSSPSASLNQTPMIAGVIIAVLLLVLVIVLVLVAQLRRRGGRPDRPTQMTSVQAKPVVAVTGSSSNESRSRSNSRGSSLSSRSRSQSRSRNLTRKHSAKRMSTGIYSEAKLARLSRNIPPNEHYSLFQAPTASSELGRPWDQNNSNYQSFSNYQSLSPALPLTNQNQNQNQNQYEDFSAFQNSNQVQYEQLPPSS